MPERQLINPGEFEELREIEAGDGFLRLAVIKILDDLTSGGIESAIGVGKSLGPGVGGNEAQAARCSLAGHELKRMIRGITYSRIIVDYARILREWLERRRHRRAVVVE